MHRFAWFREILLVLAAFVIGWWMHGANAPVLAQHGGSGVDSNVAFQMIGTGPESTLLIYNPGTRSLYVYARAGAGSSNVPCTYSLQVGAPGLPLTRSNCPAAGSR